MWLSSPREAAGLNLGATMCGSLRSGRWEGATLGSCEPEASSARQLYTLLDATSHGSQFLLCPSSWLAFFSSLTALAQVTSFATFLVSTSPPLLFFLTLLLHNTNVIYLLVLNIYCYITNHPKLGEAIAILRCSRILWVRIWTGHSKDELSLCHDVGGDLDGWGLESRVWIPVLRSLEDDARLGLQVQCHHVAFPPGMRFRAHVQVRPQEESEEQVFRETWPFMS